MRPSPSTPSPTSSSNSWFAPSLAVGLAALAAGCVVRTQPQPVYYANDEHLNPRGQAVVADFLVERLGLR